MDLRKFSRNSGVLTACAVMVAASVGESATAAPSETQVIEQIERYCATSWKNAQIAHQDWSDCTQDALARLLERVPRPGLAEAIRNVQSPERRELNRSVWRTIARWRRRARCSQLNGHDVPDPRQLDQGDHPAERREIWEAVNSEQCGLSQWQKTIIARLRQGDTIAEIAGQLGIAPARASDEKYKALRKIRQRAVELES